MFFQVMENLIKDYCDYAQYTMNRSEEVVKHHYYNLRQFVQYVS